MIALALTIRRISRVVDKDAPRLSRRAILKWPHSLTCCAQTFTYDMAP
jgi:hypothetical protein